MAGRMRVLVTGGLGSLGRIVTRRLLDQGHDVVVTTRRSFEGGEPALAKVELRQRDVMRDIVLDERDGVDVLVHLAAALGGAAESVEGFTVNAVGPLRLLEQARAAGVRRTVFASSMSVYGAFGGPHGFPAFVPIAESHPLRPTTLYGAAKLAAENALRVRAGSTGHELACLRFAPYFGADKPPGGRRGLGATIVAALRAVRAGERATLPRLEGFRFDPIYVEDAANAVVRAATVTEPLDAADPVVHVSGGRSITFAELAETIRGTWPSADIEMVASPALENTAVRGSCVTFDTSRARKEIGFRPEYDLEHALVDCMDRLSAARSPQ